MLDLAALISAEPSMMKFWGTVYTILKDGIGSLFKKKEKPLTEMIKTARVELHSLLKELSELEKKVKDTDHHGVYWIQILGEKILDCIKYTKTLVDLEILILNEVEEKIKCSF